MKEIFQLIETLKSLGYDANRKSEISRAVADEIISASEGAKVAIYALEN